MKREYTFEQAKNFFREYIETLGAIETLHLNQNLDELAPLAPTIVNNLDRFKKNTGLREFVFKHFGYEIKDEEIDKLWKGEFDMQHIVERRDSALTLYNKINPSP